ncbi:MAG TPA: aminotransferase class V-fold PLP-dependent enzyme [Ktedonobacterales bacterium]|jgi:isopenicillin-N epimerase|nr:aminotransferase class V-fold PLP-dependent enzyme [Ktedonobacterales bacterium]
MTSEAKMTAADAPIVPAGALFQVRRDIAFLNHGSYGACPRPVFEVYQQWQRELEAQPVEFLGRRLSGLLAEARARLAAYLGADADDLVFVPNATYGMNIVARSLELQPGDEVLGTDHEYGAVARTWRFVCGPRGATYRAQPIPLPVTDADALVERLWEAVTERTRVIVVSHITSPTALSFPVAAICRRAAAHGILTVVDGAHAPGQIDLALDALGVDFYTGNLHKWLCAPKGSGFLYARPERQSLLRPLAVSWGWEAERPGPSPFQDYFEWTGTDDPAAYLSVPAAIAFQREHDWPAVRAACHTLAATARVRIAALTGLPQISPDSPDWWIQMCAAPLPMRADVPREELQHRLWEEHGVEVPITDWQGRRFVRVSIQAYNTPADVDRLLAGLAALL